MDWRIQVLRHEVVARVPFGTAHLAFFPRYRLGWS